GPIEAAVSHQQELILPRVLAPDTGAKRRAFISPVAVIRPRRTIERVDPALESLLHEALPHRVMVAQKSEHEPLQHPRRSAVTAQNAAFGITEIRLLQDAAFGVEILVASRDQPVEYLRPYEFAQAIVAARFVP